MICSACASSNGKTRVCVACGETICVHEARQRRDKQYVCSRVFDCLRRHGERVIR